jgi:hypothetical protein
MAAVWFDLLLPSQSLLACGFQPDAALSDASYSIYRNTLCGVFAYEVRASICGEHGGETRVWLAIDMCG